VATEQTAYISMAYDRAMQFARDTERRLAQLGMVLLLGNSFLVAGFAVLLSEPLKCVVGYAMTAVGITFCLILMLSIQSTWVLYRLRTAEVHRLFEQLKDMTTDVPIAHWFEYVEERPLFKGWILGRLFGPGSIYRFWLPALFLFMWIMLMIFAID